MKRKILLTIGILLATTACSYATVLTFDDIGIVTNNTKLVPDGYGGFNWGDPFNGGAFYYFAPETLTPNSGFANGLVSGDYLTTCGVPYGISGIGRITGDAFTFNGTYLTAASRDNLNIQVDGYLDDNLIYSTTVVVNTTTPTWLSFNYTNINELRFSAYGGTHHEGYIDQGVLFAMDNFTYTPEPASILLFFFGGVLLRRINY